MTTCVNRFCVCCENQRRTEARRLELARLAADRFLRAVVAAAALWERYGSTQVHPRSAAAHVRRVLEAGAEATPESSWASTALVVRSCPSCARRHKALRFAPPEALCKLCSVELQQAEAVYTERRRRARKAGAP